MNCKIKYFVAFVVGAGIGSAVTWKLLKTKYERIAQEEIDSVKEVFSRRDDDSEECDISDSKDTNLVRETFKDEKNSRNTYKKIANGYTNYSNMSDKEPEVKKSDRPYVINPIEFGEIEEYDKCSLIYFADQILADENEELVEDINNVVGFDSLNTFGQYEDDAVYVRNDKRKCDYEILKDRRRYSDIICKKPHQMED